MTNFILIVMCVIFTLILFLLVFLLTRLKKQYMYVKEATNVLRLLYGLFSGVDVGEMIASDIVETDKEEAPVNSEVWE